MQAALVYLPVFNDNFKNIGLVWFVVDKHVCVFRVVQR